ncbi:protein kinase [Microcoleus sp. FACHB-1]|nr:protein kinase [Microcoleus sp. FACHB-1]
MTSKNTVKNNSMVDMIGQLLARRYQILRVLGAGAFGQTYVAQDTHIPGNPTCVVKHLKPATNSPKLLETARELFQREAETLVKLGKHQQIPQLMAYFEEDQEFYLVQEFIEGHTLSHELQPGQRWSETQVKQLLLEALEILEFVHSHGVIHRDIKPDNMMRRESDNKLVLIDFGAIKQVQIQPLSTAGQEQSVATSTRIGTPGYAPTEQDRGKPRPNSDLYALGIVAIQALTGLHPHQFQEDDVTGELFWQHQADVSSDVGTILTKMVRYHFKDRYQSAKEALQALQQLSHPSAKVQDNVVDRVSHSVPELLLRWVEQGRIQAQTIHANQTTKNPGTVRIGRDPLVCDIVLSEPTVSGLHVEIFFNAQEQHFYLRSLQQSNPPVVDGQPLPTGEVVLHQGSRLQLGQIRLSVLAIHLKPLPGTREYTPTHQPMRQASSSPPSVATSLQPPAVLTVKQNTTLSSSRNPTLQPVSRPTSHLSSTANHILPLLMKLGAAALVSVGGGYAYLQWQSSNLASTGTSTAKSNSTANSGIGTSMANSDSTTKSDKTGTSTTKSDQTDASTTNSDKNELLSEYGSILLANARLKASGRDFKGAIALASQISASSSLYQQAQNEIAQWQGQQQQKLAQPSNNPLRRRFTNATEVITTRKNRDIETTSNIKPEEAIADTSPNPAVPREANQANVQLPKEDTTKREPVAVALSYTCSCQSDDPKTQKTITDKESEIDLTGSSCAANEDAEAKVSGIWKCNKK